MVNNPGYGRHRLTRAGQGGVLSLARVAVDGLQLGLEVVEVDVHVTGRDLTVGVRPRDQLAKEAGLAVGPRGGITIDNQCRTSDPDVFAIGECALWNGMIYGLVAPGYDMAEVLGAKLTPL